MTDRMWEKFRRIVHLAMARTDFHALYPCVVVAQNDDGTLELRAESEKVGHNSKVPMRLGLPGTTAQVAPGSRVLLGFEGGDPKRPVATLWDTSSLIQLNIGSALALDAVVKGTTYRAEEDVMLTAVSAALGAIVLGTPTVGGPVVLTAAHLTTISAAVTAITTFQAAAAAYLSTTVRVK